ncbi:arsenate reductase ArsC [bacterium]|nr:arsenate reductase ArsC [bacterium]
MNRTRILFLCTGNSCRSQMAEGWTRHLKSDAFSVRSAGVETHELNPRAVRVMAEAGVDISGQQSTNVRDLLHETFDFVITVCDRARESCPVFPGLTTLVHRSFDDPPALTRGMTDEEEILAVYRRVRDEIREFVEGMPLHLQRKTRKARKR